MAHIKVVAVHGMVEILMLKDLVLKSMGVRLYPQEVYLFDNEVHSLKQVIMLMLDVIILYIL